MASASLQKPPNPNQSEVCADVPSSVALPWWHGLTRYHLWVFLGCWLGGIFDGMDSTLMSVVLPVALRDLTQSQNPAVIAAVGGWVSAIFLLGWMAGGLVFGWVGDRFGRLKAMVFSILLYSMFTGLAGFAHTWPELALCRFLTGLGIGGELVSIATFVAEVWPERSRTLAIGWLLTSYQAGVFLAGAVNGLVGGNWRLAFGVGAVPAILVILLRLTLKESERWAAHSETPGLGVASLFQGADRRRLLVGAAAFGGLLVGYWASLSWIPTWVQSLVGETDPTGSARSTVTMVQGLGAVLGCALAGWACNRWGRKPTLVVGALASFLASGLLFASNHQFGPGVVAQAGLLGGFIGLMQAGLYIYLPELFPTRVRATATGLCLNAGRGLTAVAVLGVGPLVGALGGYGPAALTFAASYLVAGAAILWGEETRGRGLRD